MSAALAIAPTPVSPAPLHPGQGGSTARDKAHVLAELRRHIAQVAPMRPLPVGLPTGMSALEAVTGGWPNPGVALIQGPVGTGRLAPVLPALARLTTAGRTVAVVDSGGILHPPGLPGVCLDNLLLVRPGPTRVLWAAEQLARCDAIPLVVVLDPPSLGRQSVRLQRAAEAGTSAVIVVSEIAQRRLPAALHLQTGRRGPGHVQLLRGGRGSSSERWLVLDPPPGPPEARRAFPF